MRRFVLLFAAIQLPIVLACGGVMSQAGVQNLSDARIEISGMTGDGQADALAAIDEATLLAASGEVSFGELVFLQVAIDEAKADGDISATDAAVIQAKVDELNAP